MESYTGTNLCPDPCTSGHTTSVNQFYFSLTSSDPGIRLHWVQEFSSPLCLVFAGLLLCVCVPLPAHSCLHPWPHTTVSSSPSPLFSRRDLRSLHRGTTVELRSEGQRSWHSLIQHNSVSPTPWNNTVGTLWLCWRYDTPRELLGWESLKCENLPTC